MKKTIVFLMAIMTAVLLTGCFAAPGTDTIEDVQIKIIGVTQEVIYGGITYREKCNQNQNQNQNNNCCNNCQGCPACDSCCEECETCIECETCQTCETCQECEQCQSCEACQDCPICPEPEECPNCSCDLEWGDLYIYFNQCCENVCVLITFEDKTTIEECFCIDGNGEGKVRLTKPAQRVIFVELINIIAK